MPGPDNQPRFQWNAADYHVSSCSQQQWAQEVIAKLRLKGDERVLDIGCGDGKITAEIALLLPEGEIAGIDNSPDMIRFARDNFPDVQYPNLSFLEMDARELSFIEEFDVIFSNAALHWVTDQRPVLAGIYRALRPGGRLLVQMGGKGNASEAFSAFDELMQDGYWAKYFRDFIFPYGFFGSVEYTAWLTEAGFLPVRVELIPRDMIHKRREDFSGWVRTTWLPYLAQVPEPEQPQFIEALIDTYLKTHPPGEDGIIHIGMVRLEAEARKA